MPTSHDQGKDVALSWIREIAPATVVDVGAGSGTYARLMREGSGAVRIAFEAWEPYLAEFGLENIYTEVYVEDARDLPAEAFIADLVIFGDVLEHMTRQEARNLLTKARSVAAHIIVSIPVLHLDQGDVNGNPYERHVDHWSFEDMREELMPGLVKTWCGDVLAYFLWSAEVERRRAAGFARASESVARTSGGLGHGARTWRCGMNQHVIPVNDLIDHPSDEDCVCGPTPELVKNDDGTDAGWLYIHHSLDNRELTEHMGQ